MGIYIVCGVLEALCSKRHLTFLGYSLPNLSSMLQTIGIFKDQHFETTIIGNDVVPCAAID